MQVELLKSEDETLIKSISSTLQWAKHAYLAVAYATYPAFKLLEKPFELFLRQEGKLRALFDIDQLIPNLQLYQGLH